jgi:hypothetical protein
VPENKSEQIIDSARARPYVLLMPALGETRGVVVVRCLHYGHEGSLSRTALVRFRLDPNATIAAYVKRLRCQNCEPELRSSPR